ncbi:MAG TPA: secretin N-terminal domain-containing protein [Gemmatimonadaceae bacterium]|nr:secretin N-terminal domain-containing protein [Gemmatimonadaceae bacterium]
MDLIRGVRATVLLAALLAGAGAARGQQPVAPPPGARATTEGVVIDFQDADIRTVITALAEAAGLNVIYGDLPQRRITLRLRQPVPADSVRGLLRTIAESNGVRVVDQGGLLRFDAPPPAATAQAEPVGRAGAGAELHVYRLKHAKAERLAATLQSIFGGGGTAAAGVSRAPLSERLRGQQIPPISLDTFGRRLVMPAAAAGASQGVAIPAQMQGEVQIVPDETTNSLLVRAAAADWSVVQQAIAAVDLRPLQVLIEVVVAEVRRTDEIEVGVGGSGTRTRGRADASGQVGRDTGAAAAGELILRWMNGGKVDVDVALRALASRGNVRILSRPVLLAQNNQEAHILVGSQQPFVQASISGATDILTRDIIQYQKVGTQLTILPTVNPDGYVNLEVIQEVSAATNETRFNAPVISTREASTFLFVRDGQTTVIGGLIDRQAQKSRSGIPVLINIPLLGALFGTTRNSTAVSELFLFLTPHVVSSDEDVDRLRNSIEQHLDLLEREVPKMAPIGPSATPPPGGTP